jgi:hypothetical protein
MQTVTLLAGLGLGMVGALVVALADAWLSRSLLVYMDAIEANVARAVAAIRAGQAELVVTGIDRKRDRIQNLARALKTLGWLVLALGFGLQIAAICLTKPLV